MTCRSARLCYWGAASPVCAGIFVKMQIYLELPTCLLKIVERRMLALWHLIEWGRAAPGTNWKDLSIAKKHHALASEH